MWTEACEESRKQTEFVQAYMLERFGPDPLDPVAAQSEALQAYWKTLGFEFRSEEETFIIPTEI